MTTPEGPRRMVRTVDRPAHEPKLVVEVGYEVKIEQKIDLLSYYAGLDLRGQQEYIDFLADNAEYGPWECPMAFLWPRDGDPSFGYGDGIPLVWKEGVIDPEHVDITDWVGRVILREGSYSRVWTEFDDEDCEYLLERVPWMKQAHEALDGEGEVDEEALARIPGPLDTPLDLTIDDEDEDGAPCCPDPGCGGNPCTFPGYADNH